MPNSSNNQKGFSQILVIILLVLGIAGGIYLVKQPQIFKSKAYDANFSVSGDNLFSATPDEANTDEETLRQQIKQALEKYNFNISIREGSSVSLPDGFSFEVKENNSKVGNISFIRDNDLQIFSYFSSKGDKYFQLGIRDDEFLLKGNATLADIAHGLSTIGGEKNLNIYVPFSSMSYLYFSERELPGGMPGKFAISIPHTDFQNSNNLPNPDESP